MIDVSPYNDPNGIVTYEQLDDVIGALRASHGDKLFADGILPEIGQALTASGFRIVASDAGSGLSEWSDSFEQPSQTP